MVALLLLLLATARNAPIDKTSFGGAVDAVVAVAAAADDIGIGAGMGTMEDDEEE